MRLLLPLLAVAALSFASRPSFPSGLAQDDAARVECPTCKGEGRAAVECSSCEGIGTLGCSLCNPLADFRVTTRDDDETARDETLIRLREAIRESRASVGALDRALRRETEPGRVACPASCVDGKALGRGDACRYCSAKGELACSACSKKGRVKCGFCAGRKRIERACGDCGGIGRLPDPAAIPSGQRSDCSWCDGGTRACADCVGGQADSVCSKCRGDKTIPCRRCAATGIAPCRACSGTGRYVNAATFSARDCGECGKSGRVECAECDEGRAKCKGCAAAGKARGNCRTCIGDKVRPCPGCFRGAFRHWEVSAELVAKRDAESAIAFLEIARERIAPYHERRAKLFAETDEDRAAFDKDRKSVEKRIEGRLAALRRPR